MSNEVKKYDLNFFLKILFRCIIFLAIFAGITLYKVSISRFNEAEVQKIDSVAQEISTKFPEMSRESAYAYAQKGIEDGAMGLSAMIFFIPFGLLGIYLASIKNRSKLGWCLFSAIFPQFAIPVLIAFIPKLIKEIPNTGPS